MDPVTMALMMSAASAVGNGIAGMFNSPAEASMDYVSKVPETIAPYYEPYIGAGKNALGTLQEQYMQLLKNPQAIMQMLGGGYEQSPGYQYQYDTAMNSANNAAALGGGGGIGTPGHMTESATISSNLANQDYYNYLSKMLGLYGAGLSGMGGINEMGFNASDSTASTLSQNLMNQAKIEAYSKKQQNESAGGILGGLTGLTAGLGKSSGWW